MTPASRRDEFTVRERERLQTEYHSVPDFYACPICGHDGSVTVEITNAQSYDEGGRMYSDTNRALSMKFHVTVGIVLKDSVAIIKCSNCGQKDSFTKGPPFRSPVDFYHVWSDFYGTLEQRDPEEWEHIQSTNPVLKARAQKVRAIQKMIKERKRNESVSVMIQDETLDGPTSSVRSIIRSMSEDGDRQISRTSLVYGILQSTPKPTTILSINCQSPSPSSSGSSVCPSSPWKPCHLTVSESGKVTKTPSFSSPSLKHQSRTSSVRPEKRKSSISSPGVKKFKADHSVSSIASPLSFISPNSLTIDSFLLPPCDLFSPQFRCSTPIKPSETSRSVSQTAITPLGDLDDDEISLLCF